MKATIIQTDIEWANPKANIASAELAMENAPGADLYILPEMFSTGFCTEPETGVDNQKFALSWMIKHSSKINAAICGSVATDEDGKYYNRFYFVKPDGEVTCYDKKHLFTYGGEHKHYTPGKDRVIVEYKGVRILLQICYDLRFPVFARSHKDYDMIIYVASWPIPRIEAWKTLIKARAIENQCYVAAVNRIGKDPYCDYNGASAFIDPYGKIIAECEENKAMTVTTDIDMNELNSFRKKFPVLDDADSFTLL